MSKPQIKLGNNPNAALETRKELDAWKKELTEKSNILFPKTLWMQEDLFTIPDGKRNYTEEERIYFKDLSRYKVFDRLWVIASRNSTHLNLNLGNSEPTKFKNFNDGDVTFAKEVHGMLSYRDEAEVNNLREAINNTVDLSYGICKKTNQLIHFRRLEVVPYAKLSRHCI